jgi:tetratricopeptide (TPR) repeat protein
MSPVTWADELAAAEAALEAGDAAGAAAAARRGDALGEKPVQWATTRRVLGDALLLAGDRDGAQRAYDEALAMTGGLPPRHPVLALVRNSMGVLARSRGDLDAALEHFDAALASELGETEQYRVGILLSLAGIQQARGDLVAAELQTKEALALEIKLHGSKSLGACAAGSQLGALVSALGRHDEAIGILVEVVENLEAMFGTDEHLEVGIAACTLGAAFDRAGRLEEAEASYRAGLAVRERILGRDQPELAATLLNLGRILDRRGDRAGGRELAERAVRNLEGRVVPNHPFLLAARGRLAAD